MVLLQLTETQLIEGLIAVLLQGARRGGDGSKVGSQEARCSNCSSKHRGLIAASRFSWGSLGRSYACGGSPRVSDVGLLMQ